MGRSCRWGSFVHFLQQFFKAIDDPTVALVCADKPGLGARKRQEKGKTMISFTRGARVSVSREPPAR
jgi:hypothetical protein